jgi:hypothetical protein
VREGDGKDRNDIWSIRQSGPISQGPHLASNCRLSLWLGYHFCHGCVCDRHTSMINTVVHTQYSSHPGYDLVILDAGWIGDC